VSSGQTHHRLGNASLDLFKVSSKTFSKPTTSLLCHFPGSASTNDVGRGSRSMSAECRFIYLMGFATLS